MDKTRLKSLRSQAHHLAPVVAIGQSGLTDAVIQELHAALEAHELVKVSIAASDRVVRADISRDAAQRTQSALVQLVGKRFTLYRARPENGLTARSGISAKSVQPPPE